MAGVGPLAAAIEGFLLGAGLIIAIGAQNAYVLRLGLQRAHVLPVVALCAISDAVLIAAGVAGLGALVSAAPELIAWVTGLGALFLTAYGALALRRALHPGRLLAGGGEAPSLRAAVVTVLAFTWLNPHVYLDTVVLIGGLSGRYETDLRWVFGFGAMTASLVWFLALGYGARLLAPLFAKPAAWRILDLSIAAVMFAIAASLALSLL